MPNNITLGESFAVSFLGIFIVFIVLVVLIALICSIRYFLDKYMKEPIAEEKIRAVTPQAAAQGAGEADLTETDDLTAAAVIAIVAEETGCAPDRLKIISIKELSGKGTGVKSGKTEKYTFESGEGMSGIMKYKITINDSIYEVTAENGKVTAGALTDMPAPAAVAAAAGGDKTVTAPLAGSILSITVNPGAPVKAGDVLLILEALKMENEIVAPYDAVVGRILVSKNDMVNAGDTLLTLA